MGSKGHSSWNENLQRKQNSTAKSANLKENAGKIKSAFAIKAGLCAEKFGRCFEYCKELKKRPSENLRLRSTWRPFKLSSMKGASVTVEILVFCGRGFANQFDKSLADTF